MIVRSKIIVLVVLTMSLALVATVQAEARYDLHGDLIRPHAKLSHGIVLDVQVKDRGQAVIFNIDDMLYSIDEGTAFTNTSGSHIGIGSFQGGMAVDFYAIGNLLTKIWPASEQEDEGNVPPPADDNPEEENPQGEIYLENGVYKN